MRRGKARHIELGSHKPTESQGIHLDVEAQALKWIWEIDQFPQDIRGQAVAILPLLRGIKSGDIPREVITKVIQRRHLVASLEVAREMMLRV